MGTTRGMDMKAWRIILALSTLAFLTQTAAADQKLVQLVDDIKEKASTTFMTAYVCQDALGVTYYDAVRAYGENAFQKTGASPKNTKFTFDVLENRFKDDKELVREKDVMKCVWITTEANKLLHESETALADYTLSAKP